MAITTRNGAFTNRAKGKGWQLPLTCLASGATTAAANASGSISAQILMSALGTTYPGTLVGAPLPTSPGAEVFATWAQGLSSNICGLWLALLYQIGTLDLTATGDKFTHDAATFPVTRTQLGQATQPLTLLPLLYVTTATTVTAPVIILKTAAGGTGYKNQDGNNVVGTRSFTFPASATAIQSAYFPMMEEGDSGVQDVAAIQVTTAGTLGAATVFGAELLFPLGAPIAFPGLVDELIGGLALDDIMPGAPTAGTLTSYLAVLRLGQSSASSAALHLSGVLNV